MNTEDKLKGQITFIEGLMKINEQLGNCDIVDVCREIKISLEEQKAIKKNDYNVQVEMSPERYKYFMNVVYGSDVTPYDIRITKSLELLNEIPPVLRRANTANISHLVPNVIGPLEHAIKILS